MVSAMNKDAVDSIDDGYVIFSLTIYSSHAISQISQLEKRPSSARDGDDFHYPIHHSSFTEPDWHARAEKLDCSVNAALVELDTLGVGMETFDHSDVVVRAFFTFLAGAETLSARTVRRLAAVNATIWIDAHG